MARRMLPPVARAHGDSLESSAQLEPGAVGRAVGKVQRSAEQAPGPTAGEADEAGEPRAPDDVATRGVDARRAPWLMDGPALAALGLEEPGAAPQRGVLAFTPAAPSASSGAQAGTLAEQLPLGGDDRDRIDEVLRERSDEELLADRARLTARLAAELPPELRRKLARRRDAIEWEQYRRAVAQGESAPRDSSGPAQEAAIAVASEQRAGTEDVTARGQLEAALRSGGTGQEAKALMQQLMRSQPGPARALGRQHAALGFEIASFTEELHTEARRTALAMLDASTRELNDAIAQVGLAGGGVRLTRAAQQYLRDPEELPEIIADWRTLSHQPERREHRARGAVEQVELVRVVGELRALQRRAEELEREERGFTEADWMARDAIDPSRTSAGARAALAEAWLAAESAHPILLAFRDPRTGADADRLAGLAQPGAAMEHAVLEKAVPKLGNILRTRHELMTGRLDPMRLGPVLTIAQQSLRVPPGSARAAIVEELYREAASGSVAMHVLSALSLGLSLVAFVPGIGLGAKLAAEAASLAIELHSQAHEYKEWRTAGGLNNTALDAAKSLSHTAPELRPLLLRLAVAGANAASLAQLTRLATRLSHVQAAEQGTEAVAPVLRELDALGERYGVRQLGQQVEAVGGVRGPGVYPPKVFVKEGVTRLSRLNPEKVRDGLKKVAARTHLHGARLEVKVSEATAEGVSGTLRVPGSAAAEVEVTVRFTPELTPSVAHGAQAGPGRFTLARTGEARWRASLEIDPHLDPRDVDFVISHELDEVSELVRRHPAGLPVADLEREMAASVMRPGAQSGTATAHDIAQAREVVALKKDYDNLAASGSVNKDVRKATLDRAIEAAGLGDPAQIDAKLRLLRDAGAPEDLLEQVRLVEARRVKGELPQGGVFRERLVAHVLWAKERSLGEFISNGMNGGHETSRLLAMGWPNGDYVFVEVASKPAAGTMARQFEQYKWVGQGSMPNPRSGRFPGDKDFDRTGWVKSEMPKTTMDDAAVLLREAEDAWRRWNDAGAIVAGKQSNGFRGMSSNGVEISGFFAEENGTRFATSVFVEASWF